MNRKIVIASMLHDIGKLIQRATGEKNKHEEIGLDYLKQKNFDEDILEAVYCHHKRKLKNKSVFKNELLAFLVYTADNISAEHDRRKNIDDKEDEYKWNNKSALKTVFSYLNGTTKEPFAYPARDLNPENKIIYPLLKQDIFASQDKYQALKKIIDDNLDKDILPNSLLELLESTMTYITSSTNSEENLDISLFDHSKITAAIASCLYQYIEENNISDYENQLITNYDKNKKYYRLVSGDISGIQDFIYTISSKGALKSLRARSFYLEIILEHIVDELLTVNDLYRCNLLYTGGGHFYMLLPNTQKAVESIKNAQTKINDWFVNEFGHNLYIAISSVEASSNDLKNTKPIFREVSRKLSKNKLSRYTKSQLKSLLTPRKNVSERECAICNTSTKDISSREFIDNTQEVCDTCYNLFKIGEKLVENDIKIIISSNKTPEALNMPSLDNDKKYLSITTKPFQNTNNQTYILNKKNDNTTEANHIQNAIHRIYVINDRQIGNKYATKLFVGNYAFKNNENKIADFSELSSYNKGINRLAVLRCDVDNLGQTFVNGLPDEYSTISRTTSLSRQLSLFFKFYINNICESKISGEADKELENFSLDNSDSTNGKHLSVVYSGGDDVFVVGAWLDVLNFAFDLRECFKKYTCNKLTFSGGIGFFSEGYPIAQMAAQTGELEDLAKNYDNLTKDSISLFGKTNDRDNTYHWDEFKIDVYEKIKLLSKLCNFDETENDNNKILFSTSMRYKIKQLLLKKDTNKFNLSRLAYTLARIKPNDRDLTKNETLKKRWYEFRENLYNWSQEDKKSLLTAIDLIIYLNRKEVEHE